MDKKATSLIVLGLILSSAGLTPIANAAQVQDVEAAEQQATGVLDVILTESEKAQLADYIARDSGEMTAEERADYANLLKKASKQLARFEHWG